MIQCEESHRTGRRTVLPVLLLGAHAARVRIDGWQHQNVSLFSVAIL